MDYVDATGEPLIHDGNYAEVINPALPDGTRGMHGLLPRDYRTHPLGYYSWATAVDFPLIPQSEWAARVADMIAQRSQLSDLRNTGMNGQPIPSRDQNGKGYCWAHSGVSAHLLIRAKQGQPYADLSAYSIACQIKNFQDQGGWGPAGIDWQIKNGCATSKTWPQQSMARTNVNEAMKQDALAHQVIGQWADVQTPQYDRNLSWQQNVTLWLSRCATTADFNWWSHSVCGCDLVNGDQMYGRTRRGDGKLPSLREFMRMWDVDNPITTGFGLRIWNSWGDTWGQKGMGVLTGNKAIPDGSVGVRTVDLTPG